MAPTTRPADPALDPETRHAVAVLRRALVRVHPSFRFEERLAARLAALARRHGRRAAVVVAFPTRSGAGAAADPRDPLLPAILAGTLDPAEDAALDIDARLAGARRPLLVGGAITSAAISLVGVAWVAWRATARDPPRPAPPLPTPPARPASRAGRRPRAGPIAVRGARRA